MGIYGVLAPLWKSQEDLGEGLGQGSSDSWLLFFLDSFLRWIIFKVFIEFVIIFFLFYVLVFLAMSHMGSQLPDQGSNPHPLHWKVRF